MEPQPRKRVRVPDYEYNNNVAARSAKKTKKEVKVKQETPTEAQIEKQPASVIKNESKIAIKLEKKAKSKVKAKKGKKEQMEIRDLVDDVLLSVFNLLFTLKQMNDLNYVKKVLRLGAISKQFRRIEELFWRQIVEADPIFRSKLKSPKYKDKHKMLHLAHLFGCYECGKLTRYQCEECKTAICIQCYEDHYAPECNCFAAWPPLPLCQYCCTTCPACDRRVCGSCSKDCKKCGASACKACCKEKHECFGCNAEMCIHSLDVINCQCEKPKYICSTRYEDDVHLRSTTTCYQCPKEICDECSELCQNCSHYVCRKCSRKIGEWIVCKQGCIGKGVKVAKCHHCLELFVYMRKDLDIGHCGNCENEKFCKTCVEYCELCDRKLCMTCLHHHEKNCNGHVKCQKCQTQVSKISLCHTCEREAGCDKCSIKCRTCDRVYCTHCITFAHYRIYDRVSDSFKRVREAECNACLDVMEE